MTCDTVSRYVDKRAATLHERIEAMAKVQAAGYRVRARLSPIVPVQDWMREYTELFELLFRRTKPDLITLELLGWMDFHDLLGIFGESMLDPAVTRAAENARGELAGAHWGPFTQDAHEEIYRFCIDTVQRLSPHTPVSVCHGTPATWHALGTAMRMSPDHYVCNCGPDSAPGGALYVQWEGISPATDATDRH
jgi:hypothetical protein